MDPLLEAVTAVACLVSPEKVQAIASRVRRTEAGKATKSLADVVGTPAASMVIERLVDAWRTTTVSADELASMLLAASHAFTMATADQSTELVWTGPTTPFVSARRTEQALLQVIDGAKSTLFITSFVAYDVSSIIEALNATSDRGVLISILLESSKDYGGSITMDTIGKMRSLVPAARLYAWQDKSDAFAGGRVHAKVAVADGRTCFITSANLTGHAMEKNMEAGVLIIGGRIPRMFDDHLRSLVGTKVIAPV